MGKEVLSAGTGSFAGVIDGRAVCALEALDVVGGDFGVEVGAGAVDV